MPLSIEEKKNTDNTSRPETGSMSYNLYGEEKDISGAIDNNPIDFFQYYKSIFEIETGQTFDDQLWLKKTKEIKYAYNLIQKNINLDVKQSEINNLFLKTAGEIKEIFHLETYDRNQNIPLGVSEIMNRFDRLKIPEKSHLLYCRDFMKDIFSASNIIVDKYGSNHPFRRATRSIINHCLPDIKYIDPATGLDISLDNYFDERNRIDSGLARSNPNFLKSILEGDPKLINNPEYSKYLNALANILKKINQSYDIGYIQTLTVEFSQSHHNELTTKEPEKRHEMKENELGKIDEIMNYLCSSHDLKEFTLANKEKLNGIIHMINQKHSIIGPSDKIFSPISTTFNKDNPLISKEIIEKIIGEISFSELNQKVGEFQGVIKSFVSELDPNSDLKFIDLPAKNPNEKAEIVSELAQLQKNIDQEFSQDDITAKKVKYILLYDYILLKFTDSLNKSSEFNQEQTIQPEEIFSHETVDSEKLAA
ncbi:MAG: hypothetical protein ACOZAR_03220 [Patescibacteria group bacterium]